MEHLIIHEILLMPDGQYICTALSHDCFFKGYIGEKLDLPYCDERTLRSGSREYKGDAILYIDTNKGTATWQDHKSEARIPLKNLTDQKENFLLTMHNGQAYLEYLS